VVGIERALGVVAPQSVGGTEYGFGAWSDGGAATHTISTPATNTAYAATFAPCSFAISPAGQTVSSAGGVGSVSVTAPAGCAWTATSNDPWITITTGASGSGNGVVGYSVAADAGVQRIGTMTIAGQTFTVTQTLVCEYAISPAGQTIGATGGAGTLNVAAGAGCAWTAVSGASWITITGGGSGSGNGAVSYSVAANAGPARTGVITAAGLTFTITQGTNCSYAITPTSRTSSATTLTGSASVTAGTGCTWTASSNAPWITLTSGATGTAKGTVKYALPANVGPQRVGTITIAGLTFTLTQNSGCAFTINPISKSFPAGGGVGTVVVSATDAACPWTAKSNNTSWITVTAGASGTGGGTVTYSVKARTGTTSRTGSMTIAGKKFTVTQ
jgi:hypothetical protein